jgi:molecular chaperone GrpE
MAEKQEIYLEDEESQALARPSDDWASRYYRLAADFENYRKRTDAERLEQTERIHQDVLKTMLPVYDDFVHLLNHSGDTGHLLDGLEALARSWQQWMNEHEVYPLAQPGDIFDYTRHEAVLQEPVTDAEMDGKVTRILKPGYRHKDSVIRHAQVAVGRYEDRNGTDESEEVEIYEP